MGTFLYGNALKGTPQIDNILFAKVLSLNSLNFEFSDCSFTEGNMVVKDKVDGLSREGSSRVAIYKETSLPNCYTIEASFHGSKKLNLLPSKLNRAKGIPEPEHALTNPQSKLYDGKPAVYTPEIYEDMGRALCSSILDYYNINPISRISNSTYKNIEGIKADIAQHMNANGVVSYKPNRIIFRSPYEASSSMKKQQLYNAHKSISSQPNNNMEYYNGLTKTQGMEKLRSIGTASEIYREVAKSFKKSERQSSMRPFVGKTENKSKSTYFPSIVKTHDTINSKSPILSPMTTFKKTEKFK